MNNDYFKKNNFDLLRLFAASQVAVYHSMEHLDIDHARNLLTDLTIVFPGVPIFFFISGFLISKSFENNSNLLEFFQNRVLRIYPALIICFFVSLLPVFILGYYSSSGASIGDFLLWLAAQLSFVQFYNPDFIRGYGVGVLNGSLWTICVELQFYLLTPLLVLLYKMKSERYSNWILFGLIILFLAANRLFIGVDSDVRSHVAYKLIGVTFLPWFYMFLIGVFFQRNFEKINSLLEGKFFYLLIGYLIFSYVGFNYLGLKMGNDVGPIVYLPLACLIFSFAFSYRTVSQKVLGRNDVSYGVYIYHMPIVNCLIFMGFIGQPMLLTVVIFLTFIFAIFSWLFVEKPSLKLKRHPLNPLNVNKEASTNNLALKDT